MPTTCRCSTSPTTPPTRLGRVTRYAQWREAPEGDGGARPTAPLAARRGARCLAGVLGEGRTGQIPPSALGALGAAGVPLVGSRLSADADAAAAAAAELGYPVAVKAAGRTRLAKTEAAGCALDVHDESELRATVARMARALGEGLAGGGPADGRARGRRGRGRDRPTPSSGPVLTLGPGGAATDLAAAEAHVLPLTDRGPPLRRRPPAGRAARSRGRGHLEDLLVPGSAPWSRPCPRSSGLELNPVIVSPRRAWWSMPGCGRRRSAATRAPRSAACVTGPSGGRRSRLPASPAQPGRGSRGRPRVRSPRMLRRIWVVPPMIV